MPGNASLHRSLKYVPALDGLRAVAVVAVLTAHAAGAVFPGGKTGVILFFVLSGYLISSILMRDLSQSGRIHLGRFYLNRALRLFPAMLIALAGYVVLALAWPAVGKASLTLPTAPWAAVYLSNWYDIAAGAGRSVTGVLGHFWSLAVEEQFYLIWPFLLWAAWRIGRHRGVLMAALIGCVLSYGAKWVLAADGVRQGGTDLAADALLVGCILAAAVHLAPRAVSLVGRWLFWPAAAAFLAALLLGQSASYAPPRRSTLRTRVVADCCPQWRGDRRRRRH